MEKLRQTILSRMMDSLNQTQLNQLANVLDVAFYDYDIVEKSRELALIDDKDKVLVKNFLGEKMLEGCSQKTIEAYSFQLDLMIKEIGKPIIEITTNDMRYYLAKWKTENGCSNVTMNNKRGVYCSFFKWLFSEGVINDNPMARIKPFKEEKKDVKPFTQLELETLMDACENVRDRALLEFLYSTGIRVTECSNVTMNDIDFKAQTATINHGKGDKQRMAYISDTCLYWLEKYLNQRNSNDTALWVGRRGKLSKSGIESIVRKIGNKVGIDAHPHKFRHTLATDLIRRGASVQEVQAMLGHEDISTTMIYVEIQRSQVQNTHKNLVA